MFAAHDLVPLAAVDLLRATEELRGRRHADTLASACCLDAFAIVERKAFAVGDVGLLAPARNDH